MMPKARYRLADMDLDEISLVRAGDDALARVVLAKADKSADSGVGRRTLPSNRPNQEDEEMGTETDLADILAKAELPDEVRAYIEALEDEVDALSKSDTGGEGEAGDEEDDATDDGTDDGAAASDEGDEESPGDESEGDVAKSVLAKADPAIRRMIEKMDGDLKKAREQAQTATAIAKAERDERLKREFIAKAQTMPMIAEKSDELGDLLMKLHEKAPDEAKRVETLLKAANQQIASSNLFKEIGGGGVSVLGSRVESAVAELRKSDPSLTEAQAVARVYDADPSLYDEEA